MLILFSVFINFIEFIHINILARCEIIHSLCDLSNDCINFLTVFIK